MFVGTVLVNYGRGTSPILPLRITCDSTQRLLSECSIAEPDTNQCRHVAGIDCRGMLVSLLLLGFNQKIMCIVSSSVCY